MRVLHTSDLHMGKATLEKLATFNKPFDVMVDTGDTLPDNYDRGYAMFHSDRRDGQEKWAMTNRVRELLTAMLRGRPLITVKGNHDFFSLADVMRGYDGLHRLEDGPITVDGVKFAGFPEVNYINGNWLGEVPNPAAWVGIVDPVLAEEPDVLATHSPPKYILDAGYSGERYGCAYLARQLTQIEVKPQLHLFGHVHEHGGKVDSLYGIRYCNGARKMLVHTVHPREEHREEGEESQDAGAGARVDKRQEAPHGQADQ